MNRYTTIIDGKSCYANAKSVHLIAGILVGVIEDRRVDIRTSGYGHDAVWIIEAYCSGEKYREFVEKMDRLYVDNFNMNHELIWFDRVTRGGIQ